MSMFEKATKRKLRFPSSVGLLTVEDVWDLPLQSNKQNVATLDDLAKKLNATIKAEQEESFVKKPSATSSENSLKFDIVKHIINVRLQEQEAKEKAAATRQKNKRIMEIMERKQYEELENKSLDELRALLND